MWKKTFCEKFAFQARNLASRKMFTALNKYCKGDVLDVGGRDFFELAKGRAIGFNTWTSLEYNVGYGFTPENETNYRLVFGDGCGMCFKAQSFDTAVNIQVLEHVLDPQKMVSEIFRVLKPGGTGVFVIPQTSLLHELPHHYYNFTRYWIEAIMRSSGFEIVEITPMGGFWLSIASDLVYLFFKCFRSRGMTPEDSRRNLWFYILCPFMLLYALINIPICLFFGLGDLKEEPNNNLVVVRKKA